MALAPIRELGADLERKWEAAGFDLSVFPGICAEALETAQLHKTLAPTEIVESVFRGGLPKQHDPQARFGQPPVTLYRGERFFIDVLFWVDGTTTIHDHSFSGAFQVLAGQSIETTFSFSERRDFGGHVKFGDLSVQASVLRAPGDVRAVPAGPAYIHALFHLARPSVSLIVRTYKDPNPGRQYAYSESGVAFDTQTEDEGRDLIVRVAEMLRRTENPEFESRVGDLIAESELHVAFAIVRACAKWADSGTVDRLIGRLDDEQAQQALRDWVVVRQRTEFLISRRNLVQKSELRFLLAVLLNAKRRTDALALVAGFNPEVDPAQQIAAWLRELSAVTVRLRIGNEPFEPNILGLPPFGPGAEDALAAVLRGDRSSLDDAGQAFADRLRALPPLRALFDGDAR